MLTYQFVGLGPAPNTYTTTSTFVGLNWRAEPTAGVGYSFLTAPPAAPCVRLAVAPQLRVSDNGNLAIENANLTRRQPRHFFANPVLIDGWNQTLTRLGSQFQLFPEPNATITFTLPVGGTPRTLVRVWPANLSARNAGDQMTVTENCDGAVVTVTGSFGQPEPVLPGVFIGTTPIQNLYFDYFAANSLTGGYPANTDLPVVQPALDNAMTTIAQRYGNSIGALGLGNPTPNNPNLLADLQARGLNRFARPSRAGQGLYTGSLGPQVAVAGGHQVQDYANGRALFHLASINQVLWGFHWGGVIAMDGTDYITLENYARSAEVAPAVAAPPSDRLYYFQMYGAGLGQTWHEQWEPPGAQGKGFANGITTVVQPTTQTGMQYFNAGSKNNQAAVAAAANPAQLQGALLDGLNYANMHLDAPSPLDRVANKARLLAWRQAVTGYLNAPPGFAATTQITALARHVSARLNAVTAGI